MKKFPTLLFVLAVLGSSVALAADWGDKSDRGSAWENDQKTQVEVRRVRVQGGWLYVTCATPRSESGARDNVAVATTFIASQKP